eukprot:5891787-Pyramimonas_sp.AAC.3
MLCQNSSPHTSENLAPAEEALKPTMYSSWYFFNPMKRFVLSIPYSNAVCVNVYGLCIPSCIVTAFTCTGAQKALFGHAEAVHQYVQGYSKFASRHPKLAHLSYLLHSFEFRSTTQSWVQPFDKRISIGYGIVGSEEQLAMPFASSAPTMDIERPFAS